MDIPIIFEDDSMLVVNKPAGIVVNRAETTRNIETIQDWVEHKFIIDHETSNEFADRGGIVHRLDKDTSGVLLIAKTPQAFENLKNQFKDRETAKTYLALVHGKMQSSVGKVDAPIERSPFNRMHYGVFVGGRAAQTSYKTLKTLKLLTGLNQGQDEFSLLEVKPETGRTHQIRVHMKHLGHPVVADPIYGGRKQIKSDLTWCPRLFLHAQQLEIKHPKTGKTVRFEAPLPQDLVSVLKILHDSV